MSTPVIDPRKWEGIFQTSDKRGRELLDDLANIIEKWRQFLATPYAMLFDSYGVPVIPPSQQIETAQLHYRMPLVRHGLAFATLSTPYRLEEIRNHPQFQSLLLKSALTLMDLTEWSETEAERRGEKIRLLAEYGLTPEVSQLLALCGLHESEQVMVAFETAMRTPFQRMEVLRRFVISQAWRYHYEFPWLAYLPDGIMLLTPGSFHAALKSAERWNTTWLHQEFTFPIRIYVHAVPEVTQLRNALRESRSLMQFSTRFGLTGVINRAVDNHFVKILAEMTPTTLKDMVESTLGPLLKAENQLILETLNEYLANGQSMAKTGRALYVHPNTVLYRIHHAEKLLGVNLKDTEQLTNLWIALRGHMFLNQLSP